MSFRDMAPKEADRILMEDTIKQWRDMRTRRLALEKDAEMLKRREQEMKSWLIEAFREQKYEGLVIGQRITGLSTKEVPTVDNRTAFVSYIYANQAIDLLQFRLNPGAIAEREADGESIPGVNKVETYDLFDRKA